MGFPNKTKGKSPPVKNLFRPRLSYLWPESVGCPMKATGVGVVGASALPYLVERVGPAIQSTELLAL